MAPEAVTGGVTARVVFRALTWCVVAVTAGCGRDSAGAAIAWSIQPSALIAGSTAQVAFTITTRDGAPASGAQLRLEGHMSHPGMTPVVADPIERDRGTYEAPLQFTMPGEWVLVVSGTLADGTRITKETRLSVRPADGATAGR